jgi:hypothetical protein
MPFTNSWSDIVPADTDLADEIGADFRRLRVDIHERMNAVLTVDWTTDPLVLKTDNATGLKRIISAAAFNSNQNAQSNNMLDGSQRVNGGGVILYAPLDCLPVGAIINLVEWMIDRGTALSFSCSLCRLQFVSPLAAVQFIDTVPIAVAGLTIQQGLALTHTIDAGYQYFLKVTALTSGSGLLYGARITYTLPTLASR